MEVKNTNRVDTGVGASDSTAGFPSHLIDPSIKQQPEWCLTFIRGMHTSNSLISIFRDNADNYKQWRDYAKGTQEIDQYKEQLSSSNKKNKGKRNNTWKNLDYSIMPILPKFVRILEGMIMKEPRIIAVKGIDNESLDAERVFESKMAEWVFNREWLSKVQGGSPNLQVNSPVAEGNPEPMTEGEIPLYKDLFYKDQNALELKDMIDTTLEVNKMTEQGRRDFVKDIIEVGVGGTKSFVDTNGFIKTRRVIPERIITNSCRKDDFGDISWVGEYLEMTIQELKQEAGNQFTEEEYKKIAESAGYNSYSSRFTPTRLNEDILSFPYDNEKITVLDGEWFSVDSRTSKIGKNSAGNNTIERVASDFLPNGVSDDDYKEKFDGERYLVRRNLKNVYRGKWIVDTNFIYSYGLQTDMIRMGSALEGVKLSYSLHTTSFDSLIRKVIPIADQIQINWLQFQNHNARSRPSGLSIEMSALENLSLGKGGEKMTPKDALRLYFDTGILLWRRKEWSGHTSQWRPVDELKNEPSAGAQQSLSNILQLINMLRNILGINEVADASVPNVDIGKFVTESAMVATRDAVNYLFYADKKIYEETAERIALLIPSLIKKGKSKAFINALGVRSYNFFKKNNDLTLYEFSTKIEAGYSDEQRAIVHKYLSLDIQNGALSSEDGIKIENEENPHKQAQMLRQAKLERQRTEAEISATTAQQEVEKNTASAQASASAEVEKEQMLSQIRIGEAEVMSSYKKSEYDNQVKGDIIKLKLEAGIKLTEQEEEHHNKITTEEIKSESSREVAHIKADSAEMVARMRPKPTATSKPKEA